MSNLQLTPSDADLSGPTTVDTTAPKGLIFQYADEAKPLATPWQVAVERAKMVRKCKYRHVNVHVCGKYISTRALSQISESR